MKTIWHNGSGQHRDDALLAYVLAEGEIGDLYAVCSPVEIDAARINTGRDGEAEYNDSRIVRDSYMPIVSTTIGGIDWNRSPNLAWVENPAAVVDCLRTYGIFPGNEYKHLRRFRTETTDYDPTKMHIDQKPDEKIYVRVFVTCTSKGVKYDPPVIYQYRIMPVGITTVEWKSKQISAIQAALDDAAANKINSAAAKMMEWFTPRDWLSPRGKRFADALGVAC